MSRRFAASHARARRATDGFSRGNYKPRAIAFWVCRNGRERLLTEKGFPRLKNSLRWDISLANRKYCFTPKVFEFPRGDAEGFHRFNRPPLKMRRASTVGRASREDTSRHRSTTQAGVAVARATAKRGAIKTDAFCYPPRRVCALWRSPKQAVRILCFPRPCPLRFTSAFLGK